MTVAALVGTLPAVARAQAPAPDGATTVVVTGTRTPEAAQRSTVRTQVVTRDEAERRGAANAAEALASQPGVRVDAAAYGYLGGVSGIQIMGFDRDRVLVLEDGERLVGDAGGAIDLASIPLVDVDRLEIVAGPSSALYGSAALGGVVNVITAPPRREGASGRGRLEGRSPLGGVAALNAAYRVGRSWAAVDGQVAGSEGLTPFEDKPDTRVPDTFRGAVGLRAGTSFGPRVDARLRVRWVADRQWGVESRDVPGLGRYLLDLPERGDRLSLHWGQDFRVGDDGTLRITLGRQTVEGRSDRTFEDSPIGEVRTRHYALHSFEAIGHWVDGPRTYTLGTRFEGEHVQQVLAGTQGTADGPRTTVAEELPSQGLARAALYGQLSWRLVDEVTVLAGLRGEEHSRYGADVAPRLAIAVRPVEHLTLRASGGRGFRAPSAKELGFVFDHSAYGYRIEGNQDLRPETSWGVAGDARVDLVPGRLAVRGGAYANWVRDLIEVDVSHGQVVGTVEVYRYGNVGRARTAGYDVGVVAESPGVARCEVTYDHLYTRDDDLGEPLGGRPPHTVTSSLRVELPASFAVSTRHRLTLDAFVTRDLRSPAYQTIDARLERPLWPCSLAYGGVLNALDARQEPGRIGDLRPPLGRVLYAGLRADFPSENDAC